MCSPVEPEGLGTRLAQMSDGALTLAQRYFSGNIGEEILDSAHAVEVGKLTQTLRRRLLSRPLASESFLRQVLHSLGL